MAPSPGLLLYYAERPPPPVCLEDKSLSILSFSGGRETHGRRAQVLERAVVQPAVVALSLFSVMEPDDNPFRRPTGQASINATPNPLPAVAADAVDGTGQRQCGCARLAEANATAQQSITVGADVLGSLQTQRAQLISTQGTLAQQQSDLNRAGLCRNQGLYGRPARPNRLIGRGWPELGAAEAWPDPESSFRRASWPQPVPPCFLLGFDIGAGTLVGQMMRRALTNKVVLRVIALTLLALIIIILVAKYAPRSGHSDH